MPSRTSARQMFRTRTGATFSPPVMQARRWLEGATFSPERPLINVSQAAPVEPPVAPLREAMAQAALNDDAVHLYGPVLGDMALRTALAQKTSLHYKAQIQPQNVAITSGCNQAFAASIAACCDEGDEVIIPTPWYFNHKMWLDQSGVHAVALPCDEKLMPQISSAQALITPRTRAIALVSPNNPAGVEYPAALLQGFFQLAQENGLALILDETYRDFHSQTEPPHALFQQENALDTFIHLYSFSKAFRLTGHRVGAVVTSAKRLSEMEKFLDTVTICPNQIAQKAALWGLQNLQDWLQGERQEILKRCDHIKQQFSILSNQGWVLKSAGAYFAYLQHPFSISSADLAPLLVTNAGVLCLPGTMFCPQDDPSGARHLRIAFANLDQTGIDLLFDRLSEVTLPK